ncbi:MAG: DUF2267 domain-containing protein [Actinomycetota bacterium]|nr:DUF2267 domain-containing protein [Actinomycetota bacterium]
MNYDDLTANVRARLGLSSQDEADAVTRSVLVALGARLTKEEGTDLAAQFPDEVGDRVRTAAGTENYGIDGFLDRVRESLDLGDPDQASHHARAVLAEVNELVTAGEMEDVFAQLPDEFSDLFMSSTGGG